MKKGDTLHFIDLYSTYDSSGKFKDTAVFVDSNWQQTSSYPEGSSVVSGNKSGVDIRLLEPIHGVVRRPSFTGDFGMDVYVKTDNVDDPYTAYAWARAGMDSAEYSIEIPASDTSSTYKLYYVLSYGDGLKAGTWYLKADGTFTEDPGQAASFPVSVRTQDFTPLAAAPFIKGKIYVPDAVGEDSNLSVTLHSYVKTSADVYETYNYYTFPLDEEDLKKDKNGRYFEYALASESLKESGSFCLEYWANNEDLDCKDFYVLADGTVTPVSDGAYCFTYDGSNPVTRDFKLLPWDDGVQYVFESGHGLIDETVTYTYAYPGECGSLTLTFTDRSNDIVNINGTPYSTAAPVTVTGKKAAVEVTFEGTNRYGFAVTDITPNGVTKKKSGVAAVYTPDGDSTADVVKDLKDTKEVSATVSTDGIATGTKLVGHAALYDKDGRFLGLSKADDFVADGSSNAGLTLTFDKVSKDTAQVTVVVVDTDFKPMGECMTK